MNAPRTNQAPIQISCCRIAGFCVNARMLPALIRRVTSIQPTTPNSAPDAPALSASWPMTLTADPTMPLPMYSVRNLGTPIWLSARAQIRKPNQVLQIRCRAPMCRNIDVPSRQYSPGQTSRRPTAPNWISVALVRVSPTDSATRNTSAQTAKSAVVAGAARSVCQNGGRGGRGASGWFTLCRPTGTL